MAVKLHILFIDDSENEVGLIIRKLVSADYIVDYERVTNKDQMRAALLKDSWDLVLSDFHLSHFDGAGALLLCQEISADLPFIIISNPLPVETIVSLIKAGAHDYLAKDNLVRLSQVIEFELNEAKIKRGKRPVVNTIINLEERYRNFFENGITGNFLADADGYLIDYNPVFAKIFGYESDFVQQGHHISEHLIDGAELNTILSRLKAEKNIGSIHHELIRKDGERIICLEYILGIFGKEGELEHFLGYLIDITAQKQMINSLKESEIRYRTLFSEMMEGFALHEIIYDESGQPVDYRFLTANPAFEHMTGLKASEIINRTIKEAIPLNGSVWIEQFGKILINAMPSSFEQYAQSIDKYFHVMVFSPKKGQFASIVTDITERKKTEELVYHSKERLIRGESVSKSGNWEFHLDTGLIKASQGACKLYGIEGDMWNFDYIRDFPLPDYRDELANALEQLIKNGVPYDMEFKIRQRNTDQIIDIHSIAEYNPEKRILFGVVQDITNRKHTEEALKESEERYHSLFDGSPDSIILCDPQTGLITDVNLAACRLSGRSREELIGMHQSKLHPSRNLALSVDNFRKNILKLNRIEGIQTTENYILTADGSEIPIEILGNSFTINNKQVIQGIFRNITERKNHETELINSEQKYRELANSLPVSVFETDLKGNIIFANATAFEWFGHTELTIEKGINIAQIISEKEHDKLIERFSEIISQDQQFNSEYTAKRKDGSCFPVLISSLAVKKNGKITGVRGTVVDLSEQRQTHNRLKKSERTLNNLMSNLPGFVYRCKNDKDWTMEYLSEGFSKITGYSIEDIMELKKLTYNDIIHPDYRSSLWDQWQVLLELKVPLEVEYPIITKSGEIRWVWERGRGIFNDDELLYLEGFIADITERKRAEQIQKVLYDISTAVLTTQSLEELIEIIRNELGNLLDTSNFYIAFYNEKDGMLTSPHFVDEKDSLKSWPAKNSLSGYLIKQKKAMLVSAEDILKLVNNGDIELIGSPSKLWLGVPLYEDKKIIGVFVVQSYDNPNAYTIKDVEMLEFISHQISLFVQRKRAEGEIKEALLKAEESDRLKSAFLATMNHELRTPLNHILGFCELILSGVMPEENQNFASSIYTSGKSLLAIIEDVFDLALAEHSNVKVRLQTFRLMDQFMENKSSFDQILQGSGKSEQIQLIFKPDTHLLAMYLTVDRSKVNQVLINLFKNAVKFTNIGTIEFGYQSNEPGKLTFFIKDTGIGIPKDKQAVIFDFFRQGDDSRTRAYGGVGIGLAIAQKITMILKGELSVVSELNKGSAFYLTVPVELADVNDPF